MKKFAFIILILIPLITLGQAEKRYRSIIVDSLKALNGGRVDVKDTLLLDSLAVYNTDLSLQYTSRSLVDSAFVGTAISASGGNTIYSADDDLAGNRTVTMGANSLTFSGNLTTFKGIDATSSNFSLDVVDNVNTKLFRVRNDGHIGINNATPVSQLHVIANQQSGIRFGNSDDLNYIEFGTAGGSTVDMPTLRAVQTGTNGRGTFYINEIAVANDVLGATPFEAAVMFIPRKVGGGTLVNSRLFTIGSATSPRLMIMPDGDMLFHAVDLSGFLGNNTPDVAMDFRLSQNDVLGIRNGQIVGNNATQNSPILRSSGLYDSDPGAGVTSTDFKSEIRTFVTTAGASPTGRLALSVEGNEGLSIDENGDVTINNALATTGKLTTLGVAATTFVISGNVLTLTGDGGGNTIATITGATDGQLLTIIFIDNKVTITDDNGHGANTIDLSAAFTSDDDTVLQLIYDGTSFYEISRSIN